MTCKDALDRLIEKLEERAKRYEELASGDSWGSGVASATKWALEDAQTLKSLVK